MHGQHISISGPSTPALHKVTAAAVGDHDAGLARSAKAMAASDGKGKP